MRPTFVLVHSPLVGPSTWSLVDEVLNRRGFETITPRISGEEHDIPFWQQHAMDVVTSLEQQATPDARLLLVGHSGAGSILPAIRQLANRTVAGYVFVDAGIPVGGMSRLDQMGLESPQFAEQFRDSLQSGTPFPAWTDEDLRDIIPDPELRGSVVQELQPRSLAYFDEPIPVFDGWPDAPCAYIQLTSTYNVFAERARTDGWDLQRLDGGHFHMLVDSEAVATALIRTVEVWDQRGS